MSRRRALRVAVLASAVALSLMLGASPALADDCATQEDCEETTGYVGSVALAGSVLAMLTALLGADIGRTAVPAAFRTPRPASGGAAVAEPEPIIDPFSGEELVRWEPGSTTGWDGVEGEPGWVFFQGRWQSPEDVNEFFAESLAADARREREADAFVQNAQDSSLRNIRDMASRAQADADWEARQRQAEELLRQIQERARERGDDEIWERTLEAPYNEDGTIDVGYVERLRDVFVDRIDRERHEPVAEDPSLMERGLADLLGLDQQGLADFAGQTFDDARHNIAIRLLVGIGTGGSSEVVYLSQAGYDAMAERYRQLEEQGRAHQFDWTEAMRAGTGGVGGELLPTNVYNTLQDPNATWTDLATSLGFDALALLDLGDLASDAARLTRGADAPRPWQELSDAVTGRGAGDGPIRVEDVESATARDPRSLADGEAMRPHDIGMGVDAGRHARSVAERHGVVVDVRSVNEHTLRRLGEGDLPKPAKIKQNTMNDIDALIGAPPGQQGRVVHFEPRRPGNYDSLDPATQRAIDRRMQDRQTSWEDNQHAMEDLVASGDIRIENGLVIDGPTGRPFTGDYDIFDIRDPLGRPVSPATRAQVVADLAQPPFSAQHGAHTDWRYDPEDPVSGTKNRNVDERIRAGAQGTPNISFRPDGQAVAARHQQRVFQDINTRESFDAVSGRRIDQTPFEQRGITDIGPAATLRGDQGGRGRPGVGWSTGSTPGRSAEAPTGSFGEIAGPGAEFTPKGAVKPQVGFGRIAGPDVQLSAKGVAQGSGFGQIAGPDMQVTAKGVPQASGFGQILGDEGRAALSSKGVPAPGIGGLRGRITGELQ